MDHWGTKFNFLSVAYNFIPVSGVFGVADFKSAISFFLEGQVFLQRVTSHFRLCMLYYKKQVLKLYTGTGLGITKHVEL